MFDIGLDRLQWSADVVAIDGPSPSVDQEFLKVPAHVVSADRAVIQHSCVLVKVPSRRTRSLEVSEEWVFVLPVDFDPAEQGQIRHEIVTGSDVADPIEQLLAITTRFLQVELIAREGKDF